MTIKRFAGCPILILIPVLLILVMAMGAFAAERCEEWTAKVVSVQGSVQARRGDETHWTDLKLDDVVCPGDMIRVQEYSRTALVFRNQAIVRLDQNTAIILPASEKKTAEVNFLSGIALFFSRFPFSLRIFTPFVSADVEGTEFLVKVSKGETRLSVFEGRINAWNEAGSARVGKGETAISRAGEIPVIRATVRPADAVNWALYYPPVPERDLDASINESTEWGVSMRESMEAWRKGDLPAAFAGLEKSGLDAKNTVLLAWRAFLLLSVGRWEEAASDLDAAISIDPHYSYAFALKSVMAVVQNRKEEAGRLAAKAVELNQSSSAALIALSYVRQARFDLDGALLSVEQAAAADPRDALVKARLAELWLSKGYLDKALDAAGAAASLNPKIARTQTVLGFAFLTQINTDEAKKAFRKAIRLDQADPLPRLGLGLVLIREGDLKAGREEIEIAAALDPNNSLVRSYLGKAYFEEKEDKKAGAELSRAKELDPQDPTPWFYDALRKQTVNRPAEALKDLQKSIELNDNRAVYRSRMLLDEDLAARGASLARIYDDLGFQWLALTEASKSLDIDPASSSAHRFLADSYFSLPRHEIARVSELLQSQLLQPINILPVQPQLAESRLFPLNVFSKNPSFNEYTSLFTRNQVSFLLSGAAGERGTISEDAVLSGIMNKFSYSLGQFHLQTDGFRTNNDQTQNLYDAFTQINISPKTSIQTEFRHKDFKRGDLLLLFDSDLFDPTLREEMNSESFRLGLHHSFVPGSDIIGSFMYLNSKNNFSEPGFIDETSKHSGYSVEGQHIFRSEHFNLVAGAGYFNDDQERDTYYVGELTHANSVISHSNMYLYSHLNFPSKFWWTLGVSADFFEDPSLGLDDRQVNPKFGVKWTPFEGTTLRGSVFRTYKRTLLSNQTIEPTQVAGFNQFFDDPEGTSAWRYGIGADQKITDRLFIGAEFSWRDMDMPGSFFNPSLPPSEVSANEQLGRAYLYWTPHPWLALGPEYQYELSRIGPELPLYAISRIETHRVGLGIGFYHPSGFLARIRPTFVFQSADLRNIPFGPVSPGESRFAVLDAAVGYRLPRRLGIIELVAKNLFDESFRFQDIDPENQQISARRLLMARWTLWF